MVPIAVSEAVEQRQGFGNGYCVRVLFAQTSAQEYAVWAEAVGEPWQPRLPKRDGWRIVGRVFIDGDYQAAEEYHKCLLASLHECATGPVVEPVSAY